MTSNSDKEAFVWIWLPDETEPVVAGRLEAENGNILFNYGKSGAKKAYVHICLLLIRDVRRTQS